MSIFLAHIDEHVLAATSLANTLINTFNVIFFGILGAINILIAYHFGAHDKERISLIFRDGLWLAFILTIPAFYICWNIAPFLSYVGLNPILVKLMELYFHALAWGLLPTLIFIVLIEFIIGIGKTRLCLIWSILQVSLNIFLSYVLIFGKWGFPNMGIAGAGWGTTISFWITTLITLGYVLVKKEFRCYVNNLIKFTKPFFVVDILKIGLPIGAMYGIEIGFFFVFTLIISSYGLQLLAANQVAMQYIWIQIPVFVGIGQAITIRVGHLLGESEIISAKYACYSGVYISTLYTVIVALFYWLFPNTLVAIDFDINNPKNYELVHLAIQFLAVSAIFQIIAAIRIALIAGLRALQDTSFILLTTLITLWFISLPVGYLLSSWFQLKGLGMWWGTTVGLGLGIPFLYWRIKLIIDQKLINAKPTSPTQVSN